MSPTVWHPSWHHALPAPLFSVGQWSSSSSLSLLLTVPRTPPSPIFLGWELLPPGDWPPTAQAFSCIDQNRDGIICKLDLRETYSQLGECPSSALLLQRLCSELLGKNRPTLWVRPCLPFHWLTPPSPVTSHPNPLVTPSLHSTLHSPELPQGGGRAAWALLRNAQGP